jgi:L(+)-tartrate dehydratase beta subunit
MASYRLTPPLTEEQMRALHVGDILTLDGTVWGIRDATQIRIFDHGVAPPESLVGAVCIHTAPGVRKVGDRYEPVSIGTTTSTRMERFTPGLMEQYGVRAIIGKAGLLEGSMAAMARHGGCYLTIVGGAAALETIQIEEIEAVYWEDLMPECLWKFRVRDFGPLIVSIDSHGRNLYADVKTEARERLPDILRGLKGADTKELPVL